MEKSLIDESRVAGFLTITRLRDGQAVEKLGPFPNKVVSSSGHGRNIIARQLAGDTTYGIEIDSAAVGDSATAAADGNTDLGNSLVSSIDITKFTVTNNVLQVDVFVADGNLADDTYQEFGLFCGAQLFARIIIDPAYTKASGEDTLFTYTLTISG